MGKGEDKTVEENKNRTNASSAMLHKKKSQVFLDSNSIVKMLWNLQELAQRTNRASKALIGGEKGHFWKTSGKSRL